ncbi:FAD binding domain-containing [Fusarium albosuccineum]|uniref:FAD binding domain-containing n=1 Tax=Fusarium albosuccineum TaxID=1237068 RepID=A0A8H4L0F0_9HYPO|nr:FAD binding domain-containing [Fusarium albosuccineum]
MAPSIFIVPGMYEGPTVFGPLADALLDHGFTTVHITTITSTGTKPPHSPTMDDDIAAISQDLSSVVERAGEEGVVAVLHSAGGFLGSAAMKELTRPARKASGKAGGAQKIIFLSAGAPPEGFEQGPLPFMNMNESEGTQTCHDPMKLLFNDVPDEEARGWVEGLQAQPVTGWGTTLAYCGWREVPSVYIVCDGDQLLPAEFQENQAARAGSEIIRLAGAGHMAQLSQTEKVASLIAEQAR